MHQPTVLLTMATTSVANYDYKFGTLDDECLSPSGLDTTFAEKEVKHWLSVFCTTL